MQQALIQSGLLSVKNKHRMPGYEANCMYASLHLRFCSPSSDNLDELSSALIPASPVGSRFVNVKLLTCVFPSLDLDVVSLQIPLLVS